MAWLPEAEPQDTATAAAEPSDRKITTAALERGITRVVHFTRTRGLTGILYAGAIKARAYLPADDQLQHVYSANAGDRSRDVAWHGYVNMSISHINVELFGSSKAWHPDAEWVILAFSPALLADPGIVFCTTNNAYPVVHRARGLVGFEQMFAPVVPWGKFGSRRSRVSLPEYRTTCPQAEALYPNQLSLDHLESVIVGDEPTYETVYATLASFPFSPDIELKAEAFQ